MEEEIPKRMAASMASASDVLRVDECSPLQKEETPKVMADTWHGQSKGGGCPLPCCGTPTSIMDANIGLDDESVSIVIIGGGPHALAALAALQEKSLAFGQYMTDSQFQARVGFDSFQRIGSVCVIDPGSHFMQSWNARFSALEINHLRSPAFAHPVAFEPTALLNFAIREGRTAELIDGPASIDKWLATTDLSQQEPLLKALPSSALFRDFCASLEQKLPHLWRSGKATRVCKDESTGKYRVHYTSTADGRELKVVARAVILATGPVGKWNVPRPFVPHLASGRVLHTEEMLTEGGGTLREEITKRCREHGRDESGESGARTGARARVLVVGGGISAAQAALAAYHAGHEVVLRSRRRLRTRAFDIASEWLDMRHQSRLRFEFLSLPVEKRHEAVREATSGGSVPASYMEELHQLAESSGRMRLEIDEDVDLSDVRVDAAAESVLVNGHAFEMVILATGVVTEPLCSPLYRSVQNMLDAPSVDGLPLVDSRLRWSPEEDVFVLGANALLELGPGGGNLMGAMRGARVVSDELRDLVWKQPKATRKANSARNIFANQYALLLGDDDDEDDDEEEETSDADEEAESREAAKNAAAMAALSGSGLGAGGASNKKATKAQAALRKARKHRKATKGRRGMG